jgi:D-glycero-D-manno-heptose 1,7-bisphosphate phosphatase
MSFEDSHRAAAVFFDKDGTLVEDLPYNVDPGRMSLVPGALRALAAIADAGLPIFVVTNQPGVALGLFAESRLPPVERWLRDVLADRGLPFGGMYWCPHHPQGLVSAYAHRCRCRKPLPGLLLRAAREHGVALARSWVVGDTLDDVEAAHRAGCRAILFDNGHERGERRNALRTPDYVVSALPAAAELIVARPALRAPVTGPSRLATGPDFFG